MSILALTIKWFGQACFLITTAAGTNIVFDPFPAQLGRTIPAVKADVVFVSHEHFDHNAVSALTSAGEVIGPIADKPAVHQVVSAGRGVSIACESVLTYHDSTNGSQRGTNTVRVIEVDDIRICHLGDLGHLLTKAQVKAIGRVDVLMIPVGGVYTIDAAQARKVVRQLNPRYVLPMHYKTPWLKVKLAPVNDFLKGFKNVKRMDKIQISKASLPKETTVVVLKY